MLNGLIGSVKKNSTTLRTRLTALLLMGVLLPSCGLRDWRNVSRENEAALRDPVTVTLLPSVRYQFKEGYVDGHGQKFFSHYAYRRAIIIGDQ
jgi:hypothetical protein